MTLPPPNSPFLALSSFNNFLEKDRKAKAAETKVGVYKHNMYKGGL
jgi:hypothetical protein